MMTRILSVRWPGSGSRAAFRPAPPASDNARSCGRPEPPYPAHLHAPCGGARRRSQATHRCPRGRPGEAYRLVGRAREPLANRPRSGPSYPPRSPPRTWPHGVPYQPLGAKYARKRNFSGQKIVAELLERCRVGPGAMVMEPAAQVFPPLPGEDHTTLALPEVASWIAIYEELSSVLRLVLTRMDGDGEGDAMAAFRRNLNFVDDRLTLWRDRHQALAGVTIDRKDHSLTFGGRYLKLTRREADLLDFLIRHPGRHFTTRQLTILAWQNSRLSDAQVRT